MASKQEIELIISPEGKVEFTIKGISGPDCEVVAKKLAEKLGVLTSWKRHAEYYQKVKPQTKVQDSTR